MESLSAQDATFLFVENECNHMQIAAVAIFEGPSPAQQELETMVESKLDRLPRYRQRVHLTPLDLAQPYWADDPDFDLAYHLRRTALPRPGSATELQNLVGRVMSQKLDRNRALWEMWIIERLTDDRWAILCKTHHCLADGVSGAALLATMLETTPTTEPPTVSSWSPRPAPRPADLVAHAIRRGWRVPMEGLRGLGRAATAPGRALQELGAFAEGLQSFRSNAAGPLETSLNGPIGPHRRWSTFSVSLQALGKIRAAHRGTVNDVVLAAVGGGFRHLLRSRGEDVDGGVVRTLVPVSTHRPGDTENPGNHVAALVVDLALDDAPPVQRLADVHQETVRLKRAHQADATETLSTLVEASPPALLSFGAGYLSELEQHAIQTVTTNVRGPGISLYALGRRLQRVSPYVPLWGSVRIAIAVFSYAGELTFGITGDYESAGDLEVLAEGIEAELAALSSAA